MFTVLPIDFIHCMGLRLWLSFRITKLYYEYSGTSDSCISGGGVGWHFRNLCSISNFKIQNDSNNKSAIGANPFAWHAVYNPKNAFMSAKPAEIEMLFPKIGENHHEGG